jgi:hypothetical protein
LLPFLYKQINARHIATSIRSMNLSDNWCIP